MKAFLPLSACLLLGSLIFASQAAEISLLPQADTYLRANQPTTAFGTATTIETNNANGVRVMLLRFDLRSITEPIVRLRLLLTPVASSAGNQFEVFGVTAGENWAESSVTWATAPGVQTTFNGASGAQADYLQPASLANSGLPLASYQTVASGAAVAFDASSGPLLDFVIADADRIVTFLVAESDPADNSGDRYNAREAATGQPVLTVTTGVATAASWRSLRVVLVAGQSNADGRAAGADLPLAAQLPQASIPFYYSTYGAAANSDGTLGTFTTLRPGATQMPTGGFGPEVALGAALAGGVAQQPGVGLAIIKYAKGGSNLYQEWKADGTNGSSGDGIYYQTFQRVVKDGLARLKLAFPNATVSLAGMVWVQGESDLADSSSVAMAYGANLAAFIGDVRQTVCPTLPFFFSRISSQQSAYSATSSPSYANYLTLRQQQQQVADSVTNTYLIDTDSAAFTMNSDGIHFNAGGQVALGTAFARSINAIIPLRAQAALENGALALTWNGVPGKRYRVETSSDLAAWTSQDVGSVSSWTDSTSSVPRYGRVVEIDDTVSLAGSPVASKAVRALATSKVLAPPRTAVPKR